MTKEHILISLALFAGLMAIHLAASLWRAFASIFM